MHGTSSRLVLSAVAALAAAGCAVSAGGSAKPSAPATSTGGVADAVDRGVVDIVSTLGLQNEQAAGTGIVLTAAGEVLTNNHVVSGATSISATDLGNGRTYQATLVGYDRSHDLAVLQLRGASGLPTLDLATTRPSVGTPVTAIGNAGGAGGTPAATSGKITDVDQTITATDSLGSSSETLTGLIAVDANLQPGDSGGPLVDNKGQVIGIDTAANAGFRFQDGGTGPNAPQGFAIPAAQARTTADAITAGRASATVHLGATAFLGVSVTTTVAADGTPGAQVAELLPGSPARQTGIMPGDVITALQGRPTDSASALTRQLDLLHPGDQATVTWTDPDGAQHSATLRLGTGPAG